MDISIMRHQQSHERRHRSYFINLTISEVLRKVIPELTEDGQNPNRAPKGPEVKKEKTICVYFSHVALVCLIKKCLHNSGSQQVCQSVQSNIGQFPPTRGKKNSPTAKIKLSCGIQTFEN
uniref:Uncharacterized protein n=1 Tax=Glossina austeni TaxID=7395 RepID=A0A1A9VDU5_GLOAU